MNDDEFDSIDDAAAVAALDTIEKKRGLSHIMIDTQLSQEAKAPQQIRRVVNPYKRHAPARGISQNLGTQFSQEAKAPQQIRHVVNPYKRHAPERGVSQNLGAQFSQEAKAPHQKRHVVNPYSKPTPLSEAHHKLSMDHNVNWSAETDTVSLSAQDKDRLGATQSTTKHSQAVSVVTPTKERTQQKPTTEEDEFGDMDEDLLVAQVEEVERQLAKKHGTGMALVTPTKKQFNEITLASSTDEFGDLDETVLVEHVEKLERKVAKKPITPQQHLSTPKNYKMQYKTPQMPSRKLQLKQVSPAKKHGAPGTLIGITVMDPDEMSALTTHDPIVSSQDSNPPEPTPEEKATKQRLVSMARNLEKVLKRNFRQLMQPKDSLETCLRRLKQHDFPRDLLYEMENIRWLGDIAAHRSAKLPDNESVNDAIKRYQTSRQQHSDIL